MPVEQKDKIKRRNKKITEACNLLLVKIPSNSIVVFIIHEWILLLAVNEFINHNVNVRLI